MAHAATQDAYAVLLRDEIGPALRRLGFKGSAGAYTGDRSGAYVSLGFQRSSFGDRTRALLTVNVTVAPVEAWDAARRQHPHVGKRPAPNTIDYPAAWDTHAWSERIGLLMPTHTDKWWDLRPDTDLRALANEVLEAIRDFVVPAIEAHLPEASNRATIR